LWCRNREVSWGLGQSEFNLNALAAAVRVLSPEKRPSLIFPTKTLVKLIHSRNFKQDVSKFRVKWIQDIIVFAPHNR
jgi:hypothetical protein